MRKGITVMPLVDQAIAEIIAREHRRCRATGERDWDFLAEVLAEEFSYTHTDGVTENKEEYLVGLRARHLSIERDAISVQPLGDVAIMTGTGMFTLWLNPTEPDAEPRYRVMVQAMLGVWAWQSDAWRMVAFQGTRKAALEDRTAALTPSG
jgi:hypothetical protein